MKKILILCLFISFKMFGQIPKMEIVASTTEDIGGLKVVLKKTNPINYSSAIQGLNNSTNGLGNGVYGSHSGSGAGVYGWSSGGNGVYGFAQFGTGTSGVYGLAYGTGSKGINGYSENGNGHGVYGSAESGNGVTGYAQNYYSGTGIGGHFSNASSTGYALVTGTGKLKFAGPGVGTLGANKFLKSINTNGDAEWSDLLPYDYSGNLSGSLLSIGNTHTTAASTIVSFTNSNYEVGAVYGVAINAAPTLNPSGVKGVNNAVNSNGYGVFGEHNGYGTGVYGSSTYGFGVKGESTTNYGVHGLGGNIGVWGRSPTSQGVQGSSNSGIGGFFTSASGYALITGTGNVGIGLLTPNELLDVNGRLRIRHNGNTSGLWLSNSTNSIGSADGAFYGMKNDTETGIWIGNAWRFWVNNAGNGYLNGSLIQTSDRRLKKDFSTLKSSLSSICKLNGYNYKWIEEARSKDLQTGLIAQEVQKIFPELVQTDEKGFLSVNYIGLVPHLIEAVKELLNENNSLKNNNQTLASRLDKIEAMLISNQANTKNLQSIK